MEDGGSEIHWGVLLLGPKRNKHISFHGSRQFPQSTCLPWWMAEIMIIFTKIIIISRSCSLCCPELDLSLVRSISMDKKIQSTFLGGSRRAGAASRQRINRGILLPQMVFAASVLVLAVLLSACSASPSGPATPTQTTVIGQINPPAPTATPAPTTLPQPTASPARWTPAC